MTEAEKAIVRGAGDFIRRYEWNWWCTLTFRTEIAYDLAESTFRRWLNKLNRKTFGNNYYKRPGEGLQWLRGTELQQRGVIHFHVLIAGDPKVHPEEAAKMWLGLAGDAQITVYDSDLGAAYYIVKRYSADGNLDLGGVWPQSPTKLNGVVRRPTQGS